MSVGSNLQEMENVVTKGASPAEPMQKSSLTTPGQTGSWEDLGGPTPENYRPDDDSAKLKDPSLTLAQVKNVVNAKASAADTMKSVKEEAEEEEEETEEDDENEDDEKEYPKKKKVKKSMKNMKEESEEEDEYEDEDEDEVEEGEKDEFDVEEDVQALLAGEELSEEFQEKARTIFEAAIRSKIVDIKEELQYSYEKALVEQIETIKEGLEDRIDSYLEYVADEWVNENALVIEQGLKTEMTESFLQGMKSLFEDHYVSIPEEKYDVVESMVDKLDEMEGKLNEQIERNVALNRRLAESVADVIFADISEGLALSQKDKLSSLAVNVEFDSEENYREKLVTLRESYFPHKAGAQRDDSETLTESTDVQSNQPQVDGRMASYLQTLGRVAK